MKRKVVGYDYGECEICNTPMQEKCIKQDFWIRGKLIVVEDVPAGVCPRCGEKIVKANMGRRIMKLIEKVLNGLLKHQESLFQLLSLIWKKQKFKSWHDSIKNSIHSV